jgi:hypothetical protein
MLWWIVDNAPWVLFFLGIVALCFGAAWWTTRKNKLLIPCGIVVGLMVLVWVMSLFVVTDRMQLERDVQTMRDLVNAGKFDEAIEHFDEEVKVDTASGEVTVKKSKLRDLTKGNMSHYRVKKVVVHNINVEEVNRPKATVSFLVGPDDSIERGRCRMGFGLTPQGKWRVQTFTVESMTNSQKAPLLFPFGG